MKTIIVGKAAYVGPIPSIARICAPLFCWRAGFAFRAAGEDTGGPVRHMASPMFVEI
jgi:hypothetical protein